MEDILKENQTTRHCCAWKCLASFLGTCFVLRERTDESDKLSGDISRVWLFKKKKKNVETCVFCHLYDYKQK